MIPANVLGFVIAWTVIVLVWLIHETAPTRRRNRALRKARKNNLGS